MLDEVASSVVTSVAPFRMGLLLVKVSGLKSQRNAYAGREIPGAEGYRDAADAPGW